MTQKNYIWKGKDAKGEIVTGELKAKNINEAKTILHRRKIRIIKITIKYVTFFSGKNSIAIKDMMIFTRQLATMLTAGIPLVQSFDIVGKSHPNPKMTSLLNSIKADVEAGQRFSNALQQHSHLFNYLFCSLVAMGEQVGALDKVLDRLATYQEKSETLKSKIKKALIYPAIIVTVTVFVTAIILIFVTPQFEDLFRGFGADLPYPTQLVVKLSEFVIDYGWMLVATTIIIFASIRASFKRHTNFRYFIEKRSLKLPVFGNLLTKAAVARFARTLSTTVSAGIPIAEALHSVAPATGNIVFELATKQLCQDISHGQTLHKSLQSLACFPEMVRQMIAIGEESGELELMLNKIADYYEEEVDNTVDAISTLIEPILMVILGLLIGSLIIAMYLPIFNMGSVV